MRTLRKDRTDYNNSQETLHIYHIGWWCAFASTDKTQRRIRFVSRTLATRPTTEKKKNVILLGVSRMETCACRDGKEKKTKQNKTDEEEENENKRRKRGKRNSVRDYFE